MKIGVILNSTPNIGGAFQYSETILDALNYIKCKNSNIEIIAVYENILWKKHLDKFPFEKVKTNLNINKSYIDNIKIEELRKIFPKIHMGAQTIIDQDCDVWICPTQDLWSFILEVPMISTIHDLMHRYESRFPEVSENGEYNQRELLCSNVCRFSRKVLVDSECGKSQVIESYNVKGNNISVLPYIPPKNIFNTEYDINVVEKFNIKEKYIFYPAQFWEHKNHINLIKALAIVKKQIKDIQLVLSGSTKYSGYGKVISEIKKENLEENVVILGYISESDIISLYKSARMMVMPTFFGPTNIPPLEAMALKCPMAISRIYGMPEQIGKAALYFDPKSPDEMAECILKIYNDNIVKTNLIKNCSIELKNHTNEQFYKKLFDIILESTENSI